MIECKECGKIMKIISREQGLIQSDICDGLYDMTEGQMTDYMTDEISEDYGEWAVNIVTYEYSKCGKTKTMKYI